MRFGGLSAAERVDIDRAVARIDDRVTFDAAYAGGRRELDGGKPAGFEAGAYVDPTLFTGVNPTMRIARDS